MRCSNKEEISSTAKLVYSVTLCKEEHPECNSRVSAILSALEKNHLTPKFRGSEIIQLQNYKTATFEDIANKHLPPLTKEKYSVLEEGVDGSGETHTTDTTFKESLVSAGAGISLVDYVVISAQVLMHGDVFYDDPDVFFLSIHQDGILPGAGKIDDIGCGNGVGTTLNLPLPQFSGYFAMQTVMYQAIVPCAQRFKPDIILVSAGYDGHVQDPRSKLQFMTLTYYMLASGIKKLAKDLCGGRCVFFLEGGYNLESLSNSVAESFRAIIGEPYNSAEYDSSHFVIMEPYLGARQVVEKIKQLHSL
ncbi:histone deacetylase 14 [Artemisia annua]|uniref:Histone deacetylase 14 n=1 Tax=Artemisia annua TaxID=35608 RepID=A0A2U1KLA6_ARTAN|nr:histone deacetylase 14 [Artemisia annua]